MGFRRLQSFAGGPGPSDASLAMALLVNLLLAVVLLVMPPQAILLLAILILAILVLKRLLQRSSPRTAFPFLLGLSKHTAACYSFDLVDSPLALGTNSAVSL